MQFTTIEAWDPMGSIDWIRRALRLPADWMPRQADGSLSAWCFHNRSAILAELGRRAMVRETVESHRYVHRVYEHGPEPRLPWWQRALGLRSRISNHMKGEEGGLYWTRPFRGLVYVPGILVSEKLVIPERIPPRFHVPEHLSVLKSILDEVAKASGSSWPDPEDASLAAGLGFVAGMIEAGGPA